MITLIIIFLLGVYYRDIKNWIMGILGMSWKHAAANDPKIEKLDDWYHAVFIPEWKKNKRASSNGWKTIVSAFKNADKLTKEELDAAIQQGFADIEKANDEFFRNIDMHK